MSNILITGTGKGLGKAMKEKLISQGHKVISFNLEDGRDVRSPDISDVWRQKIDVLINNAGVNIIDWLENFEESDWDKVMDTNAKGIYMMTKACLPALIKSLSLIHI